MKKVITALCIISLLSAAACVKYDKKCKADHKAAKKKGTRGWVY